MVWDEALFRGRILQPTLDRRGHPFDELSMLPRQKDPSILQVDQQSRREAQRFFKKRDTTYIKNPHPTQYFSPKLDILYLDHLCDFQYGGCCDQNVIARCESMTELRVCENIALRLRIILDLGATFYIWMTSWYWWFPNIKVLTVVVDYQPDLWKRIMVEAEIQYAANLAFEWIVRRYEEEFMSWTPPRVEVTTPSDFNQRWLRQVRENDWQRYQPPVAVEAPDSPLEVDFSKYSESSEEDEGYDSGSSAETDNSVEI